MSTSIDVNFPNNIPIRFPDGLPINGSLTLNLGPISLNEIDIKANAAVHLDPLHLSVDNLPPIRLALEPIRCHIPVNMAVGFSLFGKTIACLRFFGETQFIAEPYKPNPCESCPPALEKQP